MQSGLSILFQCTTASFTSALTGECHQWPKSKWYYIQPCCTRYALCIALLGGGASAPCEALYEDTFMMKAADR